MTDSDPSQAPNTSGRPPKSGCGSTAIMVMVGVYTTVLTLVFLAVAAFMWEFEFEGLLGAPWIRAVIQVGYAVGLLFLLGPLALWWKSQPARRTLRSLCLAAAYALVMSVSRLTRVSDAYLVSLYQIGLTLLFLALLLVISRNREVSLREWLRPSSTVHWLIPLLIAGIYSLAWLAIGAFGSWLDTFLNLLVGVSFGIAASVLLRLGVFTEQKLASPIKPSSASQGFSASVVLAILLAGMAPNGLQYLLMLVIPSLGWLLPLLTASGSAHSGKRNGFPAFLLISLAVGMPFMLVDPDELALATSAFDGEWLIWIAVAALGSLVVIGLTFLALWARRKQLPYWSFSNLTVSACLVVLVIMGFLIPLHAGPVFNGERLFVIIKSQADISQAASIVDYDARRIYVYQTLTSHAFRSQAGLRLILEKYHIAYQPYYLVNSLEVSGGPILRWWLASRPEVDRILDNPILRPLPVNITPARGEIESPPLDPDWNLTLIRAPEVWEELGINGTGIIIGQSDSGVDGTHPEFADRYRGVDEGDDYNWLDPWNGSQSPMDIGGHGTHTLATALGSHVGVAPGATWIGCVNLARNLGNPARYLDCMQFMLAPFPQGGDPFTQGDPTRSAHVLINSWGCPEVEGCDATVFQPAMDAFEAAGIFVVAGAGNNGDAGCGTITDPPSIYPESFTVGAVDIDSQLASFSSKGPVILSGQEYVKPDIVAPGVDVLSAFPGGSYQISSGTSMATPHVAGAVALIWSANPSLIGNIPLTRQILAGSALLPQSSSASGICGDADSLPNNLTGYGLLNVYAAVQRALNE